jgi:hypothetical protein
VEARKRRSGSHHQTTDDDGDDDDDDDEGDDDEYGVVGDSDSKSKGKGRAYPRQGSQVHFAPSVVSKEASAGGAPHTRAALSIPSRPIAAPAGENEFPSLSTLGKSLNTFGLS